MGTTVVVYTRHQIPMKLIHTLSHHKYFRYFFGILLLIALGGAGLFAYRQEAAANIRNAADLSTKLKDFIVPNIVVDGKTYSVDEGVVTRQGTVVPPSLALPILRTAYFSIANRLDPILALEGTDPEKLPVAVAALKNSLQSFSSDYDAKSQQLLADSFYPIAFLETLSALEKERRAVLTQPTPQSAVVYSAGLLASLTKYRAALKKSESAFASFGGASANTALNFPGGSMSLKTMYDSLVALDANAAAAQAKAEARLACLEGSAPCESLATLLPEITASPAASLSAILPPTQARIKPLLVASLRASASIFGRTFNERGVVILSRNACLPDITTLYAYLWETGKGSSVPALRFQPLNDLYFYDLREKTQSRFYTRMHERGINFLSQGISNLYECPDSGLDAMRVVSTYELSRNIANHPLFSPTTSPDPVLRQIAEEERRIASSPSILESAVVHYVASLSSLIRAKGERVLAQETSPETVLEAERRIVLLRAHSALFDEQIGTVIAMNGVVRGMNGIVGSSTPLFMLFPSRSYPSLLYLAGNESISPTPISFFKEKNAEPLSKFQFVLYSTLRKTYSDADILHFMETSDQAYRDADIGI